MFHVRLRSGVWFDVPRSDNASGRKRRRTITRRPTVVRAGFNALSNALVKHIVGFLEIDELFAISLVSRLLRDKAQTILLPLMYGCMKEPFKHRHIHTYVCHKERRLECDCVDEWSRPTPFMVNRSLRPSGFPRGIDRVFDYRCFFQSTEFGRRDRNYVLLCSWINDDGLRVFGLYTANCCYTGFSVIGEMQLIFTDSYEDLMESALTVFQKKELRKIKRETIREHNESIAQWKAIRVRGGLPATPETSDSDVD